MNKHLYNLKTAGYTMLKGALSRERVEALRAGMDKLLAEDDASWGVDYLKAIGQRGALRNLCDEGLPFEELLSDSSVYEIITELIGDDYILHSYDGLVLLPGDGRFPWDFHTDLTIVKGVAFPADKCPGVNCLYYIDDTTALNGATWLIAASHRSVLSNPPVNDLGEIAFQAVGKSGDALLFDARLWHCAGENKSSAPRRLIKALFCHSWIRPQMDYSRAVRPEVRARLDQRTRRLIGVGVAPPDNVADLRNSLAGEQPV